MARRQSPRLRLAGAPVTPAAPERIRLTVGADGARAEIRDLGVGVDQVLALLAQVREWDALVSRHPGLHPEDVRAALDYATAR